MQGLHKTITTTLAAILGCLYALASPAAVDEPRCGPPVGAIAPDFKVKNAVTGEEVPLSSQKGKVVVMTFWAAWCPSCRQELPVLERVREIVGKLGYGRGMITKLAAEINRALGVSATPTAEDPPARATALQPDKE